MARLIVIGGVAAGMSAAAQAKRTDESLEVIVFEKGGYISYGACGMPYYLSNEKQDYESLIMLTPEKAEEKKGVSVRLYSEVTKIDPRNKKVLVKNLKESSEEEFYYDKLIIATGASPVVPKITGIDGERVFYLKNLNHGIELKKYLFKSKPQSAVLLAEGHIGLEVAENLLALGIKDITIIAKRKHLCWWLDPEIAELLEHRVRKAGIKIVTETQVEEIADEDGKKSVRFAGTAVKSDFVFVSQGMSPNSGIAKEAGIKTGMRGAIAVNNFCETNISGIYAAGDCADIYNIAAKERIYMPRGTHANRQGRAAGMNAAGAKYEIKGITGVVVFKFMDTEIGRMGLSEEEAKRKKYDTAAATIKYVTRAGYYPGGKRIHVKLTADKKTGRLLGGQIIGGEGVAKRIDILSTALYNNMTAEQMRQLDLSYSPPFAPVWDPLLIAINNLDKILKH